jgi:hypothetical protein
MITHWKSGLTKASLYASVEETRRLASILAQIKWRRPIEAISKREMEATRKVIRGYNQALAEVKPCDRAAGQHAPQSIWG